MTGKELYQLLWDFREATLSKNVSLSVGLNPEAGSPEDEHIRLNMVDENGVVIKGTCPLVIITPDGKMEFCSVTAPATKIGPVVALKQALQHD